MEIKNGEENLLIDNTQSNKPDRICIKWKDFYLKNENNEGDGNYYCYFYTRKLYNKPDAWNLDKNHDPQIKKNNYGALYINYDVPSLSEVQFCLVDKKMTEEEAENATPENTKEVCWYKFKEWEIMEYDRDDQKWYRSGISFIYDEPDSSKQDSFLMRFNDCSKINITGDKFKQIILEDTKFNIDNINQGENLDKNKNTDAEPKVYVFAKSSLGSSYFLLQKPYPLSEALNNNFETKNCCDGYMQDILNLRFVITTEDFKLNVGDRSHGEEFKYETDRSVFDLHKDEQNNMVLSHRITKKGLNEWKSVDAEITLEKQINNSKEWQKYKYIAKAKVGLIKSFFQNHIGKTIFLGLISVGVGLFWGWIYALIPIALLIFFVILDQICDFCPGPKKILSCVMPCLSCLKETEKIPDPKMDKNLQLYDLLSFDNVVKIAVPQHQEKCFKHSVKIDNIEANKSKMIHITVKCQDKAENLEMQIQATDTVKQFLQKIIKGAGFIKGPYVVLYIPGSHIQSTNNLILTDEERLKETLQEFQLYDLLSSDNVVEIAVLQHQEKCFKHSVKIDNIIDKSLGDIKLIDDLTIQPKLEQDDKKNML